MLYISKWKAAAILLTALIVCLFAVPNFFPGEHGQALAGMGAAPHRARPRPAGRLAHPARGRCQRRAPAEARSRCRTTCARSCARRASASPARPSSAATRSRCAFARADLQQGLAKLRELSQPLGGFLGTTGARSLDVENVGGGLVRLTVTEPAIIERIRQVVDQSVEIIGRRVNAAGPGRAVDPAPGQRPHPGSGAGPRAIRKQLIKVIGKTAKLTFRLVDTSMPAEQALQGRPPPESEIVYGSKAENKQPYLLEKRVIVSGEELTDAQPGFDQRTSEPIVTFKFNTSGARKFAPGHPGERRAAVCHRARRRGDLGAGHSRADPRRQRPDFRQLHRRIGQQSRHPAARRRAAGEADRDRAARGRRRPRPGFDREGQARVLFRRRPRRRLHDRDLRAVRRFRQHRGGASTSG